MRTLYTHIILHDTAKYNNLENEGFSQNRIIEVNYNIINTSQAANE